MKVFAAHSLACGQRSPSSFNSAGQSSSLLFRYQPKLERSIKSNEPGFVIFIACKLTDTDAAGSNLDLYTKKKIRKKRKKEAQRHQSS